MNFGRIYFKPNIDFNLVHLWHTRKNNTWKLDFSSDFWQNQGPPFYPVVNAAPAPPPPPSYPPPPPPNTIKGHRGQRIDCRKLSWEQLSPDLLKQDTIWKKVKLKLLQLCTYSFISKCFNSLLYRIALVM